jgi:arginine N-succinyltransferase
MFLIRDAVPDDLKGLQRVAAVLNTVNLPNDKEALENILDVSTRSFAGKVKDPFEREYLFVMEDVDASSRGGARVIGTSQIIAQHGTREAPHIYFDVLDEERYSESIDKHFRHKVLRIGFDYDGPTEIGGLVLDPDYRRHPGKLGKQLSFVRFVFIAMHRAWFRDKVLAELLPPLAKDGRSALWEALGRRFTGLDYLEADRISKNNKEFIKNLFPSGLIYASLFDKDAREVIGKVGPATEGVKKMLTAIGFEPLDRVDPFDGGPHFEARVDDVVPVRQTQKTTVEIGDERSITEAPGESAEGLVSYEPKKKSAGRFRCVQCEFRFHDGGKRVEIPKEAAEILRVEDGEKVHALAMTRHVRM